MFDNPKVLKTMPVMYTGQATMLPKTGAVYWEDICYQFRDGRFFTTREVVELLSRKYGLSHKTARCYWSALHAYVNTESGEQVLRQVGNRYVFV